MDEKADPEVILSDMVVTRVFEAPVETVWSYWTERDLFTHWWGPTGFEFAKAEMDVRDGGRYLWCMSPPAGYVGPNPCTVGTFTEVVPQKLLRFTAQWSDEQGKALTAVEAGMPDLPDDFKETVTFQALPDGRTFITWTASDMAVNLGFAYLWVGLWDALTRLERALKEDR